MRINESITPKVSCIIPSYNESERINTVLTAVAHHPLISEVVVIDDGSTDNTTQVVSTFHDITLISIHPNQGKTNALRCGIMKTHGDFILFLDADLQGITSTDITNLLRPVLDGRTDVSISLRGNAPRPWVWIGIDYISGERVLPRSLLTPHLNTLKKLPRFGFEVFINKLIIKNNLRIGIVALKTVKSPYKNKKYGLLKGIHADIRMMRDIFTVISPLLALRQIYSMRRMRLQGLR